VCRPGAQDPSLHFSIFCLPYDAKADTPIRLAARDEARNEALSSFWLKVFPKTFRKRDLPLDESFMNKVVPEIMSQTPSLTDQGDLLKNYLQINRELRRANNEQLARLAASSHQGFLWSEPFQQLGNSQVEAQFADHRIYKYQGKEVDRQDHLGLVLDEVLQRGVLTDAPRGLADGDDDRVLERVDLGQLAGERHEEALELALAGVLDEGVLPAGERAVHRRPAAAGGAGDVVERRLGQAPVGDAVERGGHDALVEVRPVGLEAFDESRRIDHSDPFEGATGDRAPERSRTGRVPSGPRC